MSETWLRPVSFLALGLSAGVSWALGIAGVHLLLTRSRPWVAAPLIVVCCMPALVGGAVYLHGLLVFLAVV
ncbi:MAG: hypothetical protein NTW86_21390 [Candidatus Sumerlaeota bacterium]|nr:hypothetical protein [Candidatus Sumerlaeota bacterium]